MQARDKIALKLEDEKRNGVLKKCNELELVTNYIFSFFLFKFVSYVYFDFNT